MHTTYKAYAVLMFAMVGLTACGASPDADTVRPAASVPTPLKALSAPGDGWVQTFGEEFSGTSLDGSKWSATRARSNGNIWNSSCWGNVKPENSTVSGGSLHLKLDRSSPFPCYNSGTGANQTFVSTTGEVTTLGKFAQQYGYFEARVKTTGKSALQSAFWLLPPDDAGGGLYGPEVDIHENDQQWEPSPSKAHLYTWDANTNRACGCPGDRLTDSEAVLSGTDYSQDYHTFGLLWTPSEMVFYIDGQPRSTHTNNMNIFNKPMYVLLQTVLYEANIASSTPTPAFYDVDWVRVWQKSDIVGHWTFSKGTGSSSIDGSGRGNTASLVNTGWSTWGLKGNGSIQGNPDYAPTFDGSSSYVNVGNSSVLNTSGNLTAAAWVWIDTVGTERVVIGKGWDGGSTPFWLSIINNTTVRFGHYGPNLVVADGVAGGSLVNNGWHHLVGTYDGSAYRVYIDGQLKASTNSSQGVTAGTNSINIGRINENGGSKYFKGVIDEVSVYNRALSSQEVLSAYNGRR